MATGLKISRIISSWSKSTDNYAMQRLLAYSISGMRTDSAAQTKAWKKENLSKSFIMPLNKSCTNYDKERQELYNKTMECKVFYTSGDNKLSIYQKLNENSIYGENWRVTNYIQLTRPIQLKGIKEGEEVELHADFNNESGLHLSVQRINVEGQPCFDLPKSEYMVE